MHFTLKYLGLRASTICLQAPWDGLDLNIVPLRLWGQAGALEEV